MDKKRIEDIDVYAKGCRLVDEYAQAKVKGRDFYDFMLANPNVYHKLRSRVRSAEDLRAECIKQREFEVVYITGAAGSGKTTAAKYYAEQLGLDFFVSGGGDDILDGYNMEQCIILDDYRGGVMKFSEFLKFIDNNTNSSISSRYHNKDISNCRLIVITSINPPSGLYSRLKEEGQEEPIEQLYRRLNHHFFKIDEEGAIVEYTLTVDKSERTGDILGYMSDIYTEMGITPKGEKKSLLDRFKRKDERKLIPVDKSEYSEIDDLF